MLWLFPVSNSSCTVSYGGQFFNENRHLDRAHEAYVGLGFCALQKRIHLMLYG